MTAGATGPDTSGPPTRSDLADGLAAERVVSPLDSATVMVQVVSRALRGEDFGDLGRSRLHTGALLVAGRLSEPWRRSAYVRSALATAVAASRLGEIDAGALARWVTRQYCHGRGRDGRRFPGVVIGSTNGALAHVCLATGMPWLPQTIGLPVRRHAGEPDDPDDAIAAMEFGREVAPPLLERNPDIRLSQAHDGNQDRLLVGKVAPFRLKWSRLPAAYVEFVRTRLAPGAPIVVFEDTSKWPVTQVAERHVLQAGAHGGLKAEDYLDGSSRVADFLRQQGSPRSRFAAPEPTGTDVESEWGYDPALTESVREVAAETGHPVLRLRIPWPQVLSAPVAALMRTRLRAAGASGNRLLVESYVMLDPVQAVRTGSVPYWTFLGVQPGRHAALRYVTDAAAADDPYDDLQLLLYPHGVASCGSATPEEWRALREHLTGRFSLLPGTDERWPSHVDAMARFGPSLRRLPTVVPEPPPPLPVEQALESLACDPAAEVELTRL